MTRYVAVVGPGDAATPADVDDAREVGRLLADAGVVVVTGGLGGVMAAAAQGATEAGGTAVGILPGLERDAGNGHASVELPTGLGELRNGLVVRSADAVVAVGGSWGTLSEIALATRVGTPVVCLGGWHVADAAGVDVALTRAASPAEAVGLVRTWLARPDDGAT